MKDLSRIKLFTLANSLTEKSLDQLEKKHDIDLYRIEKENIKRSEYYGQFDLKFRNEAREMAQHYETFYCLERSIRSLITELMTEKFGENWWNTQVNPNIKDNVDKNMKREADSGYTQRSEEKIEYTTFGELSQIVQSSWVAFDNLFTSQRAFSKIMTSLNHLRGPIAHCCPLAPDEKIRLDLTVKDWFRLME